MVKKDTQETFSSPKYCWFSRHLERLVPCGSAESNTDVLTGGGEQRRGVHGGSFISFR